MEIIGLKQGAVSDEQARHVGSAGADLAAATDSKVFKELQRAAESVGASAVDGDVASAGSDAPGAVVSRASTEEAKEEDGVLRASAATSVTGENTTLETAKELMSGEGRQADVEITRAQKESFLDSVVTGRRYVEEASMYGGRMRIKIRCRSLDETDAIESYLRRLVSQGRIASPSEYTNVARRCLLVAQIAEVNGVEYPEMAKPYRFTETSGGLNPPAWEAEMEVFGRMPEQTVSALSTAVLRFEARYWKMVSMAGEENFWNPGESTGE